MDIHTENIDYCCQQENIGGIATRIWYAPVSVFSKFILPETSQSYLENRLIKSGNIAIRGGYELNYIDVYLEQNSLSEKLIGKQRLWKTQSELEFSILMMNDRNLSFISAIANVGLVFLIPDANNIVWVMGNPYNAAWCSSSEATTNKKYEDDNTINIKFIAKASLYRFQDTIHEIKSIGAFSSGFNTGFKI